MERREEILLAAAEMFRKKGYSRTSLADIAEAARTNRANIYYYAADKDELFAAVMEKTTYDLPARNEQIAARPAPATTRLRAMIVETMTAFGREYPYLYMHMHEHLEFADNGDRDNAEWNERVHWRQRHYAAFRKVIEDGIREGSFKALLTPATTTFALIGMMVWSYRWFDPTDAPFSGEDLGETFAELFIHGLQA